MLTILRLPLPMLFIALAVALWLFAPGAFAQDAVLPSPLAPEPLSWLVLVQQVVLLLISGLALPLIWRMLEANGVKVSADHREVINLTARNIAGTLLDPRLTPGERSARALEAFHRRAAESIKALSAQDMNLIELVESYRAQMMVAGSPPAVTLNPGTTAP